MPQINTKTEQTSLSWILRMCKLLEQLLNGVLISSRSEDLVV